MISRRIAVLIAASALAFCQDLTETDLALSFTRHQQIIAGSRLMDIGPAQQGLRSAFENMIGTRVGSAPVRHQLFLLNDDEVNAFSSGGGRVYVTRGLIEATGGNPGLLAFVLGHEMAHNRGQHAARRYLRVLFIENEFSRLYVRSGALAANAYKIASMIVERKVERDEEHEADLAGLCAAAEAGYHPDYAILCARYLRSATGEQSKFAAFFSDHPRWTTREERAEKYYDDARTVFDQRWRSVENSPGGRPPAMASVHQISIDPAPEGARVVRTAIRIRNLQGQPATVVASIFGEKDTSRTLIFERSYISDHVATEPLAFTVGGDLLKRRRGKQFIVLSIHTPHSTLFESRPIRVK